MIFPEENTLSDVWTISQGDLLAGIENTILSVATHASSIIESNSHILIPALIVWLMHHTSVASITLLLHRDMTHKSLHIHPKLKPILEWFIRMTSSIVAKEWVAAHTQHHRESDNQPDLKNGILWDPHTPQELPKWNAKYGELVKQYFDFWFREYFQVIDKLYEQWKIEWKKPWIISRYGPAWALFGSYMLVFWPLTWGIMSLTQAAMGRLTITLVNGVGHSADERKDWLWGDHSKNITSDGTTFLWRCWNRFLSFQTVGEEFHGNHHENMRSADITLWKWGETLPEILKKVVTWRGGDLWFIYAKILEKFWLVSDIKVPKKKEENFTE